MASKQTSQAGKSGKVRYGVVGLGHIAQSAILPAFANAKKNSELVALVSDDPTKLKSLGRKYGAMTFSYEDYGKALEQVDAVFIALPNTLHRAYTELAAAAKVHVLCEKPLALDVSDCEQMIEACASAGVRLMTAYRLHFERTNLEAIEIARKQLGTLRILTAAFSTPVNAGNIRLQEGEGGPLFDIGILPERGALGLRIGARGSIGLRRHGQGSSLQGGSRDGQRDDEVSRRSPGELHLQLRRGQDRLV